MTRSLGDLVKKENFVQKSEYLQTLAVIVPRYLSLLSFRCPPPPPPPPHTHRQTRLPHRTILPPPRALYKQWHNTYESLSDMVVPRSTQLIHEDAEYGLHTVTVFKKVIDEYKHHARENKYVQAWGGRGVLIAWTVVSSSHPGREGGTIRMSS